MTRYFPGLPFAGIGPVKFTWPSRPRVLPVIATPTASVTLSTPCTLDDMEYLRRSVARWAPEFIKQMDRAGLDALALLKAARAHRTIDLAALVAA